MTRVREVPSESGFDHDEREIDSREERRSRNSARTGEFERPTIDPATSAFFNRMAARGMAKLRVLRDEKCPPCHVDSPTYKACPHRDDADLEHGLDAFPLCKHAPTALVTRREKERENMRFNRLRLAGVRDEEILRVAPRSVHHIEPPQAWFGDVFDVQRHREAAGVVELVAQKKHPKYSAVVLAGAHGTGKSTIAAWGVALVERGAMWLPATSVEDGDSWRSRRTMAKGANLVVVDDLGREHEGCRCVGSCWAVEALKSLMTDLLDASIPLIVTTNLTDADIFARRYCSDPDPEHSSGTRFRERLAQRSDWLSCGAENLRLHSAAAKNNRK